MALRGQADDDPTRGAVRRLVPEPTSLHARCSRTASMVEPRGLEPLTLCLQSRGTSVVERQVSAAGPKFERQVALAWPVVAAACCCTPQTDARGDGPLPCHGGPGRPRRRLRR